MAERIVDGKIAVYRIESANKEEAETFADRVTKRVEQLQGRITNPYPRDFDPIGQAQWLSDILYEPNLTDRAKAGITAVFGKLTKEYFFTTDDNDSALLVLKSGLELLTGQLDSQGLEDLELKLSTSFEKLREANGQALAFTFDLKQTDNPIESEVELVAIGIPADIVNLTIVPNSVL